LLELQSTQSCQQTPKARWINFSKNHLDDTKDENKKSAADHLIDHWSVSSRLYSSFLQGQIHLSATLSARPSESLDKISKDTEELAKVSAVVEQHRSLYNPAFQWII